ncbi:MAG: CpaF family protein [Acidobacteria bacterium]|nr:CpaF family protein [Acidobacteriota bacterium]MBI3472057.1 CpaF family protein [Candidatus Solibacter usitatus]
MGSRTLVRPNSGVDRWFEIKSKIHSKLLNALTPEQLKTLNKDSVRGEIGLVVERLVVEEGIPMTLAERERVTDEILDEVFGLGPLEPLLKDPSISDILVNGYDNVYIERAGRLVETNVRFKDQAHVRLIIDRIVSAVGRRIDESSPIVDARLMDGSRVCAVIPPLSLIGPVISIRRYGKKQLSTEDLLKNETFTTGMLDFLSGCVEARLNVVISGGSGSGKTTLLNLMSRFIPEEERIVTIEDTAELQLQQSHVVRLETRPMNIEGAGAITQRDLVINALRMRPDRIIVGESRGAEALDMLQAMNTGHDGSMTTVHANAPRDAFSRLETMVMMASQHVPDKVIRQQLASAINIVAHTARLSDGSRRVTGIAEVVGVDHDLVEMQDIFEFDRTGISARGKVLGKFRATGNKPLCLDRLKGYGIHLSPSIFHEEHEVKDK